jgi:hypothetical protein
VPSFTHSGTLFSVCRPISTNGYGSPATSRRSKSTLTAYRVAIGDLLDWSSDHARNVFEEATLVDYRAAYQ